MVEYLYIRPTNRQVREECKAKKFFRLGVLKWKGQPHYRAVDSHIIPDTACSCLVVNIESPVSHKTGNVFCKAIAENTQRIPTKVRAYAKAANISPYIK